MLKHTKKLRILAIGLLLVAGCSSKEEEKSVDKSVSPAPVQQEEPSYFAPLTGEAVEHEITQRPIIVTINNHPRARPQSGIGSADMIFEMVAEGNVTRLLAVFQSELPKTIGPVRSARDYFIELAEGYDAFFVAHGYSPEAKEMLAAGVVDNINGMQYDGTLFYRTTNRVAPHNSYISSKNILKGADKVGASMIYQKKVLEAFYDEKESVKIGIKAKRLDVRYGSSEAFHNSYTYNEKSKAYERASGDIVTIDELSNKPIALSNVLFFEMPHTTIDSKGRQAIDMTDGGKALVCQGGYVREVQWENQDGQLVAVESDGSPVKLVAGKTWINFVSKSPGIAKSVTYQP